MKKLKKLWIDILSHFTFHHIEDCHHCPVYKKCHGITLKEDDFDALRKCGHNICKFFMHKIYNIKED